MFTAYKSLSKALREQSVTDDEALALYNFAMKGTHSGSKTQCRLGWIKYTFNVHALLAHGIYNRVMFCSDETGKVEIQYVAGQSYPDEMRTVRQCLCGH